VVGTNSQTTHPSSGRLFSIYWLDHWLCACSSVAVTDNPYSSAHATLLDHPLQMFTMRLHHTIHPRNNVTRIALAAVCLDDAPRAWTISKLLLLLAGGTSSLSLACQLMISFCGRLFSSSMVSHSPNTLTVGSMHHGATDGSTRCSKTQNINSSHAFLEPAMLFSWMPELGTCWNCWCPVDSIQNETIIVRRCHLQSHQRCIKEE